MNLIWYYFFFKRLAIVGLNSGAQPIADADNDAAMSGNMGCQDLKGGGYKIWHILAKNKRTQRKLLAFKNVKKYVF